MIKTEHTADGNPIAGLAQHDRSHRKRRRNEHDILLSTANTLEGEEVEALAPSQRHSAYDLGPKQVNQEEVSESNPAFNQLRPSVRTSSNAEKSIINQPDEAQERIGIRIRNERLNRGGVLNSEDMDELNADNQYGENLLYLSRSENGESRRRARAAKSVDGNSVFEVPGNTSNSAGSGDETSLPRQGGREFAAVTRTEHRPLQHLSGSELRKQQGPLPEHATVAGPVSPSHQLGARPSGSTDRTVSISVETTLSPAPTIEKEGRERVSNASIGPTSTNNDTTSRPTGTEEEDTVNEDERLLASEEGKNLSSKDRRRLRNKISAKAHRSRRRGMCPHPLYRMRIKQP